MELTFNHILVTSSEAPTITTSADIPLQPIVGEELLADPATVTGSPDPDVTYQWYRGDPDSSGTLLTGETALTYNAPTISDLGSLLYIQTSTANGVLPDVAENIPSTTVGATFEEDWSDFSAGDNEDDLLANGWTHSGDDRSVIAFVANTDAPAGIGAQMGRAEGTYYTRDDMEAAYVTPANVNYSEVIWVIAQNTNTDRRAYRIGNGAGVSVRVGTWRHVLPGEDPDSLDGVSLGSGYEGQIMVIRHKIEGAVSTVWLWDITENEPGTPTSQRTHTSDITQSEPLWRMINDAGTATNELLYLSLGVNTDAPRSPALELLPATNPDPLGYSASSSATTVSQHDDLITFNVEDL